jgi:hypothetical protein
MSRLVIVFAVVFFFVWVWNLTRRVRAVRAAARRILGTLRDNFAAEHELRAVASLPEDARPHLEEVRQRLGPLGFAHVFDLEDADISRTAGRAIPMRAFVCTSEPLSALAYHHPQLARTILEIGCQLSDGRTLSTSTAVEATKLQNPPELERQTLPPETSPDNLLASHRRWLAETQAAAPALTVSCSHTPEEFLQEARRVQRAKHEYRKRIGWITLDEMRALSRGREEVAQQTHAEIVRLLAREARSGGAG